MLVVSGTVTCIGFAQQAPKQAPAGPHRLALVLGNSTYQQPLINPVHDAEDLQKSLDHLGFTATLGKNLSLAGMKTEIDRFAASIQPGDVVLFYFAGHGAQIEGENLLVPTDFVMPSEETEMAKRCLRFDDVRKRLEQSSARLSILIMDACRNNPYRSVRMHGGGLAPVSAGLASYVVFAAAPGQTASDNSTERNGLFTKYLLESLKSPPPLSQLFRKVREDVYTNSDHSQRPFFDDQMIEEFWFQGASAPAAQQRSDTGVQKLLEDGAALFHQGKCSEALANFDRAIKLDPENAYAQNSTGLAYECLKQPSLAIERFSMAIQTRPDMAGAFLNRGAAYLAAGQYSLAEEDFTWAAEQEPSVSVYYVRRGRAYFLDRKYTESLADYSRAIELNPADPEAFFGRGEVNNRLGKYREAVADYDAALQRKPDYAEAMAARKNAAARIR